MKGIGYFPIFILLTLVCSSCLSRIEERTDIKKTKFQDSIINKYATNCAENYNYRLEMNQWQGCLNKGLKVDSTIAYLWQQKAMPYFKERKYEVGMNYLDKAVKYDREQYLPYRAFIKCIFVKDYKSAIADFDECSLQWGDNYVMDHTYSFYLALSYLQLNQFVKAEQLLQKTIDRQVQEFGEAHHIDLFYLAISKYELGKYHDAVQSFNSALKIYPKFSDALFYKALCELNLGGEYQKYHDLTMKAKKYSQEGYGINEANAVYEKYPYQVNW